YIIRLRYSVMHGFLIFFFFFQAEDGIRDLTVTGVQTCALPIFAIAARHEASAASGVNGNQSDNSKQDAGAVYVFTRANATWSQRSEERRVGKECRSRWWADHEKKSTK